MENNVIKTNVMITNDIRLSKLFDFIIAKNGSY